MSKVYYVVALVLPNGIIEVLETGSGTRDYVTEVKRLTNMIATEILFLVEPADDLMIN